MNKELDKGLSLLKQAEGKAKIYEGNAEGYEVHDAAPLRPDHVGQAYWDRLPPDEQRALYEHEVKREAEMAKWEVIYAERRKARLVERAAPDLLAVCEAFIAKLGPDGYYPTAGAPLTNAMRAVIAKAKGEDQ